MWSEIANEYDNLKAPVAVRSSANTEDSPSVSAAGQHDTVLGVASSKELRDAVLGCWASLYNARAISYRRLRGVTGDIAMAVIVQELVCADKAGVIFTTNPVTGDDRQMVIEAIFGLGDLLVSGRVQPDTYFVDKSTMRLGEKPIIGEKHHILTCDSEGQMHTSVLVDDRMSSRVLDDAEIESLVMLANQLETFVGAAQDIEWAIRDGVKILQSRPITTTVRKAPSHS